MDVRDRGSLKQAAYERLAQAAYDPKRLILIHVAVTVGVSLFVTALNYILQTYIADTGGLAGIGLRSILSTIQSVSSTAVTLLMPFWNLGYVAASIRLYRGQEATPRCLMGGFLRFGPALRLMLLEALLYILVCFVALQLALPVIAMTPLADNLVELLDELYLTNPDLVNGLAAGDTSLLLDAAVADQLLWAMIPMLVVAGLLCALLVLPVAYRLRMSRFCLMDQQGNSAVAAMRTSNRLMRYNCFALLRLDLNFWWVYLCQILIGLLAYLDQLLPLIGVQLPFDETAAYFGFYVLSLGAQVLLYWLVMNQVHVTYAGFYDTLAQEQNPAAEPVPPVNEGY